MSLAFTIHESRVILLDAISNARHGLVKAYHDQACTMEQLSARTNIPIGKLKKIMMISGEVPNLTDLVTIAWALKQRVAISIVPMEETNDSS